MDCHPGEAASNNVSKTLKPYETSIVSAGSALQFTKPWNNKMTQFTGEDHFTLTQKHSNSKFTGDDVALLETERAEKETLPQNNTV